MNKSVEDRGNKAISTKYTRDLINKNRYNMIQIAFARRFYTK